MKVVFIDRIKKQIEFASSRGSGTSIDGMFYPQQFQQLIVPEYFEVTQSPYGERYYLILEPKNLRSFNIMAEHVIPYVPIKLDFDDEVFEWGE